MGPTYFFIIGAQRSGTTYLSSSLDMHPLINLAKPIKPEPKTFLSESSSRDAYIRKYHSPETTIGCTAFGEKCTSYYETPGVVENIYSAFPEAKIIVMLRDPVQRALSNYFFSLENGLETRTLREVFIDDVDPPILSQVVSVSPFDYLGRGQYVKYLSPYLERFGAENIKLILFESFIQHPQSELIDLWDFLGVSCVSSMDITDTPLRNESSNKSDVSQDVFDVLNLFYEDEINRLEDVLKRDLSVWRVA